MSGYTNLTQAAGIADLAASLLFGGAGTVTLGGVAFTGFEVPERITWGGQQQLTIHKFPGGTRVIDAMGRDDKPLDWSGIFLSADATVRAQAIDAMRVGGAPVALSWANFSYTVVVASFEADYERSGLLHYRISCTVLADASAQAQVPFISTAMQIATDINVAAGLVTQGTPALALAALPTLISAAGSFPLGAAATNAATSGISSAFSSLTSALGLSGTTIDATAAAAPSGSIVGGMSDLSSMVSQSGISSALAAAKGFVGRALGNSIGGAV